METGKVRLGGVMVLLASMAAAPAFAQSRFGNRTFAAGDDPRALVVADVNGDALPDVVVANNASLDITVHLAEVGTGRGGDLRPAVHYPAGSNPVAIAAGDFDEDGDVDVVVSNPSASPAESSLVLLFNDGSGRFSDPIEYVGLDAQAIATVDVNRDGHLDLVTADRMRGSVDLFAGDGAGQFVRVDVFTIGSEPFALAVGDLNGDSLLDVAVTIPSRGWVMALLDDGTGILHFTPYVVGAQPMSIAAVDVDDDGDLDLVTADFSGSVTLLRNDGQGGFATTESFPLSAQPTAVVAFDYNEDGHLDLLVTSLSGLYYFLADGAGGFAQPRRLLGETGAGLVVADIDGDNDTDLAWVDFVDDTLRLTVRRQRPSLTIEGGMCGAGARSGTLALTIGDGDTSAESLKVFAVSMNEALVPNANLVFAGVGAHRTLTVTGAGGSPGAALIYVWTEDLTSASASTTVNFKTGGNGNDMLIGTDDVDMLFGENGDDTLDGRGGNDLLCGGRGNDTLSGGGGADHFGGGPGADRPVDFRPQDGDTNDNATP